MVVWADAYTEYAAERDVKLFNVRISGAMCC